ncbi:hypothetical protein KR222_000709 [Zaprionus bogoriensis]|nr:hypothetical protein KR222_000709 [Zaprionus bogoriensis]
MSRRPPKEEELRSLEVVQALRRELNRNTHRISQTFWQEFEQIRNHQRNQLSLERANRERITELMNETNQDTQRQMDALSRSISSHGINPLAPSPIMRRELPPSAESQHQQQLTSESSVSSTRTSALVHKRRQKSSLRRKPMASNTSTQKTSSFDSTTLPRAPPASRVTIPAGGVTPPILRTPPRNSPTISKLKLADKHK